MSNAAQTTTTAATTETLEPHFSEAFKKAVKGQITLKELLDIPGEEMGRMAETAYVLYQQGIYGTAETMFNALQALDPHEAYFKVALGAIYLAQDRLPEAEAALTAAIPCNPSWTAPYVSRGEAYLKQGKILKAAEDFEKALQIDPEAKQPETKRARMLAAGAVQTLSALKNNGKGAAAKTNTVAAASAPVAKRAAAGPNVVATKKR